MDELGLFSRRCPIKVLLKKERKVEVENKVKNDASSHHSWLLITLRFVSLLWCGDLKSFVALKT